MESRKGLGRVVVVSFPKLKPENEEKARIVL